MRPCPSVENEAVPACRCDSDLMDEIKTQNKLKRPAEEELECERSRYLNERVRTLQGRVLQLRDDSCHREKIMREELSKAHNGMVLALGEKERADKILSDLRDRNRTERSKQRRSTTDISAMEVHITCSICASKMWAPYLIVECGHTFCGGCLYEWFHQALENYSNTHPGLFRLMSGLGEPNYRCPTCRKHVNRRPTENFALKALIPVFARIMGQQLAPAEETSSSHKWAKKFDLFFLR